LWAYFSENCGPVQNVRVVRDPASNIGKGIAFVTFKNKDDVKKAINLNGSQVLERAVRITKALDDKQLQRKAQKAAVTQRLRGKSGDKSQKGKAAPVSTKRKHTDKGTAKGSMKGKASGSFEGERSAKDVLPSFRKSKSDKGKSPHKKARTGGESKKGKGKGKANNKGASKKGGKKSKKA